MYLPVYRSGVPPRTVAGRRSEIIGWVYCPFRMDDLMNGIMGERSADLGLEIFDGHEMSARFLMYRSSGPTANVPTSRHVELTYPAFCRAAGPNGYASSNSPS